MQNNNQMQLLQMISNANNPMEFMQKMLGNDPQFQKVMQIANGKTPQQLEQYTRNVCKSQGVDIDNILRMFNPQSFLN